MYRMIFREKFRDMIKSNKILEGAFILNMALLTEFPMTGPSLKKLESISEVKSSNSMFIAKIVFGCIKNKLGQQPKTQTATTSPTTTN